VAKPELGAKRQCQNCGAKFFDLNRDPIICPKCGTVFQGATGTARAQRPEVKEEEEEAVAPATAEIISLEEADAAEEKTPAVVAEDDIEVEEDDGAEDTFLEEEEEGDDDVTGLIDGDIAGDEEP
jgi:uncharacterized protein (TIGR02300 family)